MSILDKLNYLPKNYDIHLKTYLKKDSATKKLIEDEMLRLLKTKYRINSINNIEFIPPPIVSYYFFESITNLRKESILSETPSSDVLDDIYPDPTVYSESDKETGKNYTIHKKLSTKKKIISTSIFRTENRNSRLPEYLSGIMCTINNLSKIMGPEWGYRIYINTTFLKKNQIKTELTEKGTTKYEYNNFPDTDQKQWQQLFEDIDEGLVFYKFLQQINQLDYVEIFKVEVKEQFMNNGYIVGLFGTNFRFHASLDRSKDLVYMLDSDLSITLDIANVWKTFEDSDKTVTYYFIPSYKPPTHAIIQYPFSIIAYFWGIKPAQYWSKYKQHYTFDSIFDYFIEFNDKEENFYNRTESNNNLAQKASYGSDEIILTDLIFSGIRTNETKPLASKSIFNNLLLFYIFYETYSKDFIFQNILNEEFTNMKTEISKNKNNNDLKNWNTDNLEKFLFGENNLCCVLPYYKDIPDRYRTKLFYMAYNKMLSDMLSKNNNMNMNYRYEYFSNMIQNIKLYNNKLENKDLSDKEINEDLFNHTFTNQTKSSEFILPNDKKYLFNKYYNEMNIPKIVKKFIESVINKCTFIDNPYEEIKKYYTSNKNSVFDTIWFNDKKNKKFEDCKGKITLIGGYYEYFKTTNCNEKDITIIIKKVPTEYFNYENIDKPILLNNKTDFEYKIDDLETFKIIKDATINPKYHAVLWKLLLCIIDENFILMDSGNSLAHAEYNVGQYPWDDDIDIGYKTDEKYMEYFKFLKHCINLGLEVWIYGKVDKGLVGWTKNREDEQMTLENADKFNKDNIWFSKITIPNTKYDELCKKIKLTDKYYFSQKIPAAPWIDLFPWTKNDTDNKLASLYPTELKIAKFLIDNKEKSNIYGIDINKPSNLGLALEKYKNPANYRKTGKIFNHTLLRNNTEKFYSSNLIKKVNDYVENHSKEIINTMTMINCEDIILSKSGGNSYQKYLKYKAKYLELKNNY